jgi:hypothetical protein
MLSENPADLVPERACLAALVVWLSAASHPRDSHPYGVSAADAQVIPPPWPQSREPSSTRLFGSIDSTSRRMRSEPGCHDLP